MGPREAAPPPPLWWRLGAVAIAVFAFVWCAIVGSRGFFALDQSIFFDGGWRVSEGQVPFVDFFSPHGLPLLWLMGAVFSVFDADFTTYLFTGAAINALGALLVAGIARRLNPDGLRASLVGALVTALWFQAPFGTPYAEQFAFFWTFLALYVLLLATDDDRSPRAARTLFLLAGAIAFIAFLAKQNVGALALPVHGLLLWTRRGQLRLALGDARSMAAGFLAATAAFALWLWLFSDAGNFWRWYFVIPAGAVESRIQLRGAKILLMPFIGWGAYVIPGTTLIAASVSTWVLLARRSLAKSGVERERTVYACAAMCLLLHLVENTFTTVTNNSPENGYALVGLIVALGLGVVPWIVDPTRKPGWISRSLRIVLPILLVGVPLARGAKVGWARRVHRGMRNAVFERHLQIPGWERLNWGENVCLKDRRFPELEWRADDLEAVYAHLASRGGNFFVFPDHTFLYAALGKPSPQPLLWWHRGITYPRDYDRDLDDRVAEALYENDVQSIVVETHSFIGTQPNKLQFPRLWRWVGERFEETARYGIFSVLERK